MATAQLDRLAAGGKDALECQAVLAQGFRLGPRPK